MEVGRSTSCCGNVPALLTQWKASSGHKVPVLQLRGGGQGQPPLPSESSRNLLELVQASPGSPLPLLEKKRAGPVSGRRAPGAEELQPDLGGFKSMWAFPWGWGSRGQVRGNSLWTFGSHTISVLQYLIPDLEPSLCPKKSII